MTTTDITTFDFAPGMSLRSVSHEGQPWFIAKDVCEALGYSNPSDALTKHVDADERSSLALRYGTQGNPNRAVINESGLYSLILRSQKPEAKKFQKWVTSVVLPSLRSSGLYITGQEKPIPEDISLADLQAQQAELAAKVSAKLAEMAEAQTLSWAKSREEKQARRDGFRLLRGR